MLQFHTQITLGISVLILKEQFEYVKKALCAATFEHISVYIERILENRKSSGKSKFLYILAYFIVEMLFPFPLKIKSALAFF